jgi:hypothetical protein
MSRFRLWFALIVSFLMGALAGMTMTLFPEQKIYIAAGVSLFGFWILYAALNWAVGGYTIVYFESKNSDERSSPVEG